MAVRIPKPAVPDEYLVDNRVYTDQRTFDLERERIFFRVWNFVCHESEIREPGDFITTIVAGQPIIVCRDKSGQVRAFYNTCRHRAAQVVFDKSGNKRNFTCLYHLWVYDLDGRLLNAPEADAYKTSYCPAGLDRENTGLVPVRAESMHRLVFVCLDDESPSLAEFLGDVGGYIEHPFSSPELQVEVMWTKTLDANWKMQPENSRDGYHAALLHKRLRGVSKPKPFKLLGGGHAVQHLSLDYEEGRKLGTLDGVLAERPEMAAQFMAHPLPGEKLEEPSRIITLFPDTLIATRYSTLVIERQVPIGPDKTVFETRHVFLAGDTPEIKELRRQHWMLYWAQDSGNLPEDWEAWEAQQRGVQSVGVRYSLLARGEPANEGLRGDDNRIRSFWKEWRGCMGTKANAPSH
jgi:phenylpropionate dioxygenase-like ring-hydroxylating dioxygenase large terminal subunit